MIMIRHDDVIQWKYFSRDWPFVSGIHRWPVDSLHKGQWRGALMFSLISVWTNGYVNSRDAGDLRRHRGSLWRHYNGFVIHDLIMISRWFHQWNRNDILIESQAALWVVILTTSCTESHASDIYVSSLMKIKCTIFNASQVKCVLLTLPAPNSGFFSMA